MQVGCGVTMKEIRGRPYLYFWHYEDRGGRRHQVFQYIGSAGSEAARQRLAEAVDAYYERVLADVRRRRSETLARAMGV
ncbi:MAG TPA: hypothetical protein VIB49_09615 [Thermoplasmata archaeon]|jgi:hypothetical protein